MLTSCFPPKTCSQNKCTIIVLSDDYNHSKEGVCWVWHMQKDLEELITLFCEPIEPIISELLG